MGGSCTAMMLVCIQFNADRLWFIDSTEDANARIFIRWSQIGKNSRADSAA
jgi:hypothetical protein